MAKDGNLYQHIADTVAQVHPEVLSDANAASSYFTTNSGQWEWERTRTRPNDGQTVRSNEQMMQSMKGATVLLGSMNRQMNLPALQRIAMEFEKENDIMDQRQEMMDDAIDDVAGVEDEEEGEEVVNQVLDEIGIDLGQAVSLARSHKHSVHVLTLLTARRDAVWAPEDTSCRRTGCASSGRRRPWRRRPASSSGQFATMRMFSIYYDATALGRGRGLL